MNQNLVTTSLKEGWNSKHIIKLWVFSTLLSKPSCLKINNITGIIYFKKGEDFRQNKTLVVKITNSSKMIWSDFDISIKFSCFTELVIEPSVWF